MGEERGREWERVRMRIKETRERLGEKSRERHNTRG